MGTWAAVEQDSPLAAGFSAAGFSAAGLSLDTRTAPDGTAAPDGTVASETARLDQEQEAAATWAITNATLHTMERDGTITSGSIVVRDGKILAVGRDAEVPAGAKVIDATGYHLTPGLIDVRSRLFLGDNPADQSATDGSLNVIDGLDRYHSLGSEVLAAGVTAVYLQPTAAGSWGGYGATVSTGSVDGDPTGILQTSAAAQMALGGGSRAGTSRARKQQFEALQKRLKDAQAYQKSWDEYRAAVAKQAADKPVPPAAEPSATPAAETRPSNEGPPAGRPRRRPPNSGEGSATNGNLADTSLGDESWQEPPPRTRQENSTRPPNSGASDSAAAGKPDAEPKPPAFDPLKERLLPILRREMTVRFEAQKAEEIQWALQLASEFNLRLVLEGLGEMKSATSAVQDSQVPVVLGPWYDVSDSADQAKSCREWVAAFGGSTPSNRVVIATFSPNQLGSKWLRAHAAIAVQSGLSREQAMRAITLEAAQVASVADRLGSLKVGKQADLVLFAGDPLDASVPVAMVVQNGQPVLDRLAETRDRVERESSRRTVVAAVAEPVTLPRLRAAGPVRTAASGESGRLSSYALVSQQVLTSEGGWEPATIVVDAGVITQIGAEVSLPEGIAVHDVGHRPITPGLSLGWYVNSATGAPFAKDSDAAQQFAGDGFDPRRPAVKRLVESGVTAVHLVNQPVNVIAGQTNWMRLGTWGQTTPGEIPRVVAAEQWVLTETARNPERFPATLVGQLSMLRDRLQDGPVGTTLYLPDSALQQLLQERIAQRKAVQAGNMPVVIAANQDGEIDAALRILADTPVRAWLYGAGQLKPFIPRLAQQKVGVIAPAISEGQYDWYLDDLVAAHQAGIPILLAADSGVSMRATAAALVARGVSPEAGLRMILADARTHFQPQASGGLQVGAPADLLVWSGNPLDLTSRILWNANATSDSHSHSAASVASQVR